MPLIYKRWSEVVGFLFKYNGLFWFWIILNGIYQKYYKKADTFDFEPLWSVLGENHLVCNHYDVNLVFSYHKQSFD